MRLWIGALSVLGGLLVLAPSQAQALASVRLAQCAGMAPACTPGPDEIIANDGEQIRVGMFLTSGAEGVSSYAISLEFDDELDFVSVLELVPMGFSGNINAGSGPPPPSESGVGTRGRVSSLEAFNFEGGPVNAMDLLFAIVTFEVVSLIDDGPDLFAGLFNTGVDGIFDNASSDIAATAQFGTASVAPIPEPGTVALLGLGIAAMAARRRA